MAASFAAFEPDFLRFTAEIVRCTVTTVDAKGRPRSRMLHPIWEVIDGRPVSWVVTSKPPIKAAHLATNPHVACCAHLANTSERQVGNMGGRWDRTAKLTSDPA